MRALIAASRERFPRRRVSPRPTIKLIVIGAITSCSPWESMNPLIASSTNPWVALKIWVAAGVGSCGRIRPASMTRSTAATNTDSASTPSARSQGVAASAESLWTPPRSVRPNSNRYSCGFCTANSPQASPPAMRSAIGSSVFVHNIGPVLRNGRNGVVNYLSLTCTRAVSSGSSVIQRRRRRQADSSDRNDGEGLMIAGTALDMAALDRALDDLHVGAPSWVDLPLGDKVALLEALPPKILDLGPQMVAAAGHAKGIASTSAWVAEDWMLAVWIFIQNVNAHVLALKRVLAGQEPIRANAVHIRPDGQVVVDVFPVTGYDRLLLNGYKAQVWIEPGISAARTREDAAKMYRGGGYDHPGVCLVLGAGNVGSITALDILDQLYARGSVCVVKMNPVNDYLGPFYEKIFSEFVSRGWLRFSYAGGRVGGYLARHRKTDSIHMTGSGATYAALVWGAAAG